MVDVTIQPYISVIMGATGSCNLDCRYCFKGGNSSPTADMDEATLSYAITKILGIEGLRGVQFLWQGYEPLRQSMDFYRKAVELQKGSGVEIRNSMQTNATLLDRQTLEFLLKNDFRLGISLDGPKDIHDTQRSYRETRAGSFDDVMKAIGLLREFGRRVGVISVVTRQGIGRAEELYEFLTGIADGVKFRPMVQLGSGKSARDDIQISPQEYSQFLETIFPLWLKTATSKRVDPFQEVLYGFSVFHPVTCATSQCHDHYLFIAPRGDVYLCTDFEGMSEFRFGNINTDSIEQILSSENRRRIFSMRNQIRECDPCEYHSVCNSGCVAGAQLVDGRINHKDYYCTALKTTFGMIHMLQSASVYLIEQIRAEEQKNFIGEQSIH